jgi:hypothetical protein
MIGKKINQLATELAPVSTDLTIIGDPISGVSKKITLAQLGAIFSGAVSFYTDLASFPATGDINVIYCAKDTQKLYLWSGSAYTEVFPSQALLDTYQLRSEKGNANGYASLDSGGKVPISQLPSSIMEYKGTWNASTNTPTLANGTGDTGDVYICNVAGTVNFGAGPLTFAVGDYVIYSGSIWQRSSGAVGTVTSVALTVGGDAISVSGSPLTTSGTLALAFAGTSGQYINGAGSLTTFPSLTGFVPYTGATGQVNLGAYDLLVQTLTIGKGNSSLSNNTALGYHALFHITTGNYNTAVGYEAAHNTTTGQYNTALGQSALFTNTTGSQNTALGLNALLSNTTGGSNVVVGLDALQHNTTGSSNTALGYNAGSHITGGSTPNTTASSSVYIGRDTKAKVDGGTNEIVIGYNAVGNGSNTATFGNTSTTANYFTGSINGGSFVKSGGTSTQFLKADGSVDSNTYVTIDTFETITASKNFALGLSLGSAGGTNQASVFQNTSSLFSGSAGVNVFGFNSANNIYFGKGSDNGGVLQWSNSTVRYYTLPNATGTLALTSDLTGGTVTSVGLSSATSGVTIGSTPITTSGTITLAIATASGSQQGLLSSTDWTTFNNKQNALTNPVTGTGTTNYLPKFTGASTIGNSAITDDGTTVSLLSRALSGTSATFSGGGEFGNSVIIKSGNFLYLNNAANTRVGSLGTTGDGTELSSHNGAGEPLYLKAPHTTAKILFITNGDNTTGLRMTLNASGNLSIGNTNDTYKLDVSGTGRFTASGNALRLNSSSNDVWQTFIPQSGNTWRIQATTGSVFGIYNENSATFPFQIASTGAATFSSSVTADGLFRSNQGIFQIWQGGTFRGGLYNYAAVLGSGSDYAPSLVSETNLYFATGGSATQKMVITSAGSVGIGTTSPANYGSIYTTLTLNNASTGSYAVFQYGGNSYGQIGAEAGNFVLQAIGSTDMKFTTNSAERMRITSGGQLLVGTTNGSGTLSVYRTNSGDTAAEIFTRYSGDLSTPALYLSKFDNNSTTSQVFVRFAINNVGATNGQINANGANQVAFGSWSDERLKYNITELPSQLKNIMSLRPVEFDYKNGSGHQIGFIAQEMKEIYSDAVGKDEKGFLTITGWSKTEARLVKAIQELKQELDTLKNK